MSPPRFTPEFKGGFKYEVQHVLTKHETLRRGF